MDLGQGGGDDGAGVRFEVSAVNYIMDYFMQVAESVISSSLQVARGGNQPARRRRRRGSAKYGRRVRGSWQKDSTTFLLYKEQITNHPQPSIPPPIASSNKTTNKQLIFAIGAERREKKKAIAREARERAKREKACLETNKQRSKVKELCSTLSVAYRQVRGYRKENVAKEKELVSKDKALCETNEKWQDKIESLLSLSDAKARAKLSEQEMLHEAATEKRTKVCHPWHHPTTLFKAQSTNVSAIHGLVSSLEYGGWTKLS